MKDRLQPLPAKSRGAAIRLASGFTLIELMIVMTIILILLSIAAPMYRTSLIRSREAVLRDDLFTLRSVIDQYTLDKQEAPQSLSDLVEAGYLRQLPVDPFTGSSETWVEVYEDSTLMLPTQTAPGIVDVHSGSNLTSIAGEPYSNW
jgi:general secretion pathway protein G